MILRARAMALSEIGSFRMHKALADAATALGIVEDAAALDFHDHALVDRIRNDVSASAREGSIPGWAKGKARPLWNFLDFYQIREAMAPYTTNAVASAVSYVGGDMIAQLIMLSRQPFDPINIATLTGLSFYYAFETPLTFRKIDSDIPIQNENMTPQLRALRDSAVMFLSGFDAVGQLATLGKLSAEIMRQKKGEMLRALTYKVGISPFWTLRHMAILALMHDRMVTSADLFKDSLGLWSGGFLPILCLEYVIQNKIPLRYRFIAASTVIFIWQIAASIITLLK
jgi:hypothetical protein